MRFAPVSVGIVPDCTTCMGVELPSGSPYLDFCFDSQIGQGWATWQEEREDELDIIARSVSE